MVKKILVIDDQIDTLELAITNLEMEGYRVTPLLSGKKGLETALSATHDVIVLDIMMPDMDGLEVCRQLRKSKNTKHIPILMLTAKAGVEDIINGLKMGATEYLSKPFHIEEFLVRIKTLVRIKRAEDRLKKTNKSLQKLVIERTNKLIEAARFEALGKMAGSIGHDLSNLLQSIQGQNELAQMYNDIDRVKEKLILQSDAIAMMANFSANLRVFAQDQKPEKVIFCPETVIRMTLEIMKKQLKEKSIKTAMHCPTRVSILADKGQFSQICLNLITNARDAMETGGYLNISLKKDGAFVQISFQDTGCGIHKDRQKKIFDLLYTTKPKGLGTGIGLFTLKEIVQEHEGRVKVESTLGKGTTFHLWLPMTDKKE